MRPPRAVLLASFLIMLVPAVATGAVDFQENVGFAPNHYFEPGQFGENVDVTTGNLALTVPIGPRYQVNSLTYGVTLTYNSKVWAYVDPTANSPEERYPYMKSQSDYGLGWTFHAGRIFYDDPNDANEPVTKHRRIQYETPEGSQHALYAKNVANPDADYYYSKDGSYLRARSYAVHVDNDPTKATMRAWKLWEPDGTTRILGFKVGDGRVFQRNDAWAANPNNYNIEPLDSREGWYTTRVESVRKELPGAGLCNSTAPPVLELGGSEKVPCDFVEYFYDVSTASLPLPTEHSLPWCNDIFINLRMIRDSLGRYIEMQHAGNVTFSFPVLGNRVTYTLQQSSDRVQSPLDTVLARDATGECTIVDPEGPTNLDTWVPLLSAIVYPYGYTMAFEYETPTSPTCHGVMTARMLPTGARSEYEYMLYKTKVDTQRSYALVKRRLKVAGQPDAEWIYGRDPVHIDTLFAMQFPGGSIRASVDLGDGDDSPGSYEVFYAAWKQGTAQYSNPPRVFERDPDGNLTIYYLIAEALPNANQPKLPEFYGMTRAVERVRGPDIAGTLESLEGYRYAVDWEDLPGDNHTDQTGEGYIPPIWANRPVNIDKRRVKRFLQEPDGTYRTQLTTFSDRDGFGHFQTRTEYQLDSESLVYRTERTDYLLAPGTANLDAVAVEGLAGADAAAKRAHFEDLWILDIATASSVRQGAAGPLLSKSVTSTVDVWGATRESRAFPDPDDVASFVRTQNVWDVHGMLVRTEADCVSGACSGAPRTTHLERDAAGRVLWKRFGPTEETFPWKAFDRDLDPDTGLVLASRSPAGVETSYAYDDLGRLTEITPGVGEHPTTISYPSLLQTVVSQGSSSDWIWGSYRYDTAGRLRFVERTDRDGTVDGQETRYDLAGRKVFESEWADIGALPTAPGTSFEYWVPLIGAPGAVPPGTAPEYRVADPLGRLTRVTAADGATTEMFYEGLTRTVATKDLNRLPGSGTALPSGTPADSTTRFTNDAWGRLVEVDSPTGVDAVYSYDERDNLIEVDLEGQKRTFVFDGLNRLVQAVNPENGGVTTTQFDPSGLVLQKVDAAGTIFSFAYDQAGRLTEEWIGSDPNGPLLEQVTYLTYDDASGGPSTGANGRLRMASSYEDLLPLQSRTLVYQGLNGRLSEERVALGGVPPPDALVTSYGYNAYGLLARVDYPERTPASHVPTVATYSYSHGLLRYVSDGVTPGRFVSDISYNPAGGKRRVRLGNGTWTETLPDVRNRPSSINVRVQQLQASSEESEEEGDLRLARVTSPSSTAMGSSSETPAMLRPAGGTASALLEYARASEPLSFDDRGDRPRLPVDLLAWAQQIELDPGDPGGGSGGTGSVPPLLAWDSGEYRYDGAGNIIGIGLDAFSYDELSRLVSASMTHPLNAAGSGSSLTYTYDPFGNMTQWTRSVDAGPTFAWGFTMSGQQTNQINQLTFDAPGNDLDYTRNASYDPAGNLTNDGVQNYLFDRRSRLREVRRAVDDAELGRYSYDERGYRIRKVEGGVETFYIRNTAGQVLSEFRRPTGQTTPPVWDKDYIYALDGAVALIKNQVPGAPAEFRAERVDAAPAHVALRWLRNPELDVVGYRVFRRAWGSSDSFTQLPGPGGVTVEQVESTQAIVTFEDPMASGAWEYFVATVDEAGHVSADSRHLAVDFSDTAKAYINWGFLAPEIGDGSLRLTWSSTQPAPMILGYRVWRKGPSDTVYAPLTPDLILADDYLDLGLTNGAVYSYKVTLRKTSGVEPSVVDEPDPAYDPNVVAVSGIPNDILPPDPPTNVRSQPGPSAVEITLFWGPSYSSDVDHYRIEEVLPDATVAEKGTVLADATKAIIGGLSAGTTHVLRVVAVDDVDLEGASGTVMARTWGGLNLPPHIYPDIGNDPLNDPDYYSSGAWWFDWAPERWIYEWGTPRHEPGEANIQALVAREFHPNGEPGYGTANYGWPVHYRAARILGIADRDDWTAEGGPDITYSQHLGGTYLGVNFYRGGCPAPGEVDELVLLTSEPIFDGPSPTYEYTATLLDKTITGLCHTYYVTEVGSLTVNGVPTVIESTPRKVRMTYRYGPGEVLGQYAYGARIALDPATDTGQSEWFGNPYNLAIDPNGGWELGSALPGNPIVVRWRKHADPEVKGYRIWVVDEDRYTQSSSLGYPGGKGWAHLADISGREVTSYLDTGAHCNWPVRFRAWPSEATKWNYDTCIVAEGMLACNPEPNPGNGVGGPGGYFSIYWVEGLTQEQLDAGPGTPPSFSAAPFAQGGDTLWNEEVRAVGLCGDECPRPANRCVISYSDEDGNDFTCYGRVGCPDGTVSTLSWPEDETGYHLASQSPPRPEERVATAAAGPALMAANSSALSVATAGRPVLGELRIRRIRGASAGEPVPAQGDAAVAQADAPAPDRLIGQVSALGVIQWLHVDHLGSTRVVTDEAGAVVSQHKYWPFGEEIADADPLAPNTHKFTGHERDEGTGLDYMFARYYGAAHGRFLSPDPLAGQAQEPQTLNRYVYAGNNPMLFIDPDGRDFYLACEGESTTCHDGKQGKYTQDENGNHTGGEATVISNNQDGELVDQDGNKYSGSVDSEGVKFTKEGESESSTGVWQRGSEDVKFEQAGGALSGFKFEFTQSPHYNQDARGTFSFNGSMEQADAALKAAGLERSTAQPSRLG